MLKTVLIGICLALTYAPPAFSLIISVNGTVVLPVPSPLSVDFYLYNQPSQYGTYQSGKKLNADDPSSLKNTGIDPSEPLIVLVHGFYQNSSCPYPQDTKDLYLALNQGINVIAVDWGKIACADTDESLVLACYPQAILLIGGVGQVISDFLWALTQNGLINAATNVRIVGISMGAHISGEAGNRLKTQHGRTVSRITGLDPAGPNGTCGGARCLSKTDATFVDVVHSDGGGTLGTSLDLGQVNFYPNGGAHPQPTCEGQPELCSHRSSARFWMQSIGTTQYVAHQCDTYGNFETGKCRPGVTKSAIFGDSAKPGSYGNYFLDIFPINFTTRYTENCYHNYLGIGFLPI